MGRRDSSAYKKRFLKGKVCVTCGTDKDLTIDHIISRWKGGSNNPRNWQPMCWKDNQAKARQERAPFDQELAKLAQILADTRGKSLTKYTPNQLKALREHLWVKLTRPIDARLLNPTGQWRDLRRKLEKQLHDVERELNRRFIFDWRLEA